MDEPKHTPGPMDLHPNGGAGLAPNVHYWGIETGSGICSAAGFGTTHLGFHLSGFMTPQDAARLKLCWDSHDALVAALKEALGWIPRSDGSTPTERGARCETRTEALELVSAALAQADPQPELEKAAV